MLVLVEADPDSGSASSFFEMFSCGLPTRTIVRWPSILIWAMVVFVVPTIVQPIRRIHNPIWARADVVRTVIVN